MSKEQKRLAAIILCIMGIIGSLMAMKDRSVQTAGISQGEKSAECLTEIGNYDKL